MSLSLPNAIGELAVDSDAPYFEVTWTDPVTRAKGFLVLDRLVRGISSGGLRIRAGCSLSEVRGLASEVDRHDPPLVPEEAGRPRQGNGVICDGRHPEHQRGSRHEVRRAGLSRRSREVTRRLG